MECDCLRISAVVLNWKDNARTLRCLEPLLASSIVDHIYVIDNESDGSLSTELRGRGILNAPRWTLTELADNRGFAGGVNVGLRSSLEDGFDAVLVINNDAAIEDDSVSLLVSELEQNPRLGLVGPRILHADGSEESAGGFVKPMLGVTAHKQRGGGAPDFVTWACILIRSDALRDVGLLDEQFFMYWEDVDMSFRLRAKEWGIEICRSAQAMHETSSNRTKHPTAIKAYHTWSSIVFARKHGGEWRYGNKVWLLSSSAINIARFRLQAIQGLRNGIALAREGAAPAYSAELRSRLFGQSGH